MGKLLSLKKPNKLASTHNRDYNELLKTLDTFSKNIQYLLKSHLAQKTNRLSSQDKT